MVAKYFLWLGLLPVVGLSNPMTVTIQATASGTLGSKAFNGPVTINVYSDSSIVENSGLSLVGGRVTAQVGIAGAILNVADAPVIQIAGGQVSFGFYVAGHNSVLFTISDSSLTATLRGSFTAQGPTSTVTPVTLLTDQSTLTISVVPNATLAVKQLTTSPVSTVAIPQTEVIATPEGGTELTSGQAAVALYNALMTVSPMGVGTPLVATDGAMLGQAATVDRGPSNDAVVLGSNLLTDFTYPGNLPPVPASGGTALAIDQGAYENLVLESQNTTATLWGFQYSTVNGRFTQTMLGTLPGNPGAGPDFLANAGKGTVFFSTGGSAPGSFTVGAAQGTATAQPQVTTAGQVVSGMVWTPFGLAVTTQAPSGNTGKLAGSIGFFNAGAFNAFPISVGNTTPWPVSPGYLGCGYVSFLENASGNVYVYNINTQQTTQVAAKASVPGASNVFVAGPTLGVTLPNTKAVSFLQPFLNGTCWDSYVPPGALAGGRSGAIAMGPDGAMWYTEPSVNRIGRVTGNGVADTFGTTTAVSAPVGIAIGPDGNYWIAETAANKIQQTTPLGVSTEFGGLSAGAAPANIIAGPDGAMWFNESGSGMIGRMTTAGALTEFLTSAANSLAAGADGAVWYTESGVAKIGRVTSTGTITECAVNNIATQMTAGPDGAMWFTEATANKIGRLVTDGTCAVTEFSAGLTANAGLDAITLGPDGALWFTEDTARQLGRFDPVLQAVVEYPLPAGLASTAFSGIAVGIEGGIWITGNAGEVLRDMLPAGAVNSQVTVGTTSPGQYVVFDGTPVTSTQTLNLPLGMMHTASISLPPTNASTRIDFHGWSDGPTTLTETIQGSAVPSLHLANLVTSYQLTTAVSPAVGGSVTVNTVSPDGFFAAGTNVSITAVPASGYGFTNWTGSVANVNSGTTTVLMIAPETVTANFVAVTPITIQTSPEGLPFSVDGGPSLTAPQTLNLTQTFHTITISATQPGAPGTQYAFTSWSDGTTGTADLIHVTTSAATYTASFTTQYQLTAAVSPVGGGTVTPASGGFYNAGTVVPVAATPSSGFTFNGWTGPVASASSASTTVTMSAPVNVTANFVGLTPITIQTNPTGLQFSVDGGAAQTAPQTVNLTTGAHTIAVAAIQGSTGTSQEAFSAWSDGGAASHSITVGTTAATYTASFVAQYLLTTAIAPAGSGSVGASPASASGFYNVGTSVQLTATPGAGFQFTNWTGDLSGAANPQSIIINAAHSVTANFGLPPCSLSLSAASAGLPATGTATVETCPNNSGQPSCGVTPEAPATFTVTPSAACGAWTATSSSPALLRITSGASGTGAGTVSYSLLNNTHTGPQSYTITLTSGTVSATYTVNEAGSGDSQAYREVFALYEQLLGRDPDASGFAFWSGAGGGGLGQMADAFLTGPEAFNSDFAVMAAYQAATDAPPTYAQFQAAVTGIRAGTQTVSGLFSSLIGSNYAAVNLYQDLLDREPGAADAACIASGLAACFQTIIGFPASATPAAAANNEFQSTGTYNTTLAADHTNALYMQMLYYVILGRDPDQAGLAYWIGIANGGGPGILFQGSATSGTRLQILGPGAPNQGFIGSPEFQGLFAN